MTKPGGAEVDCGGNEKSSCGAQARGVPGSCTASHQRGQNVLPVLNNTAIVRGSALAAAARPCTDRMSSNRFLKESFSRWYYSLCSHGAGTQEDLTHGTVQTTSSFNPHLFHCLTFSVNVTFYTENLSCNVSIHNIASYHKC